MRREPVRVAALSTSSQWRDAIVELLAGCAGLDYVGGAPTLEDLGTLAPAPEVFIFDATDNRALEELLDAGPELPFVVLSDTIERETAGRALRLGGVALLDRHASLDNVVAALEAAASGLCVLAPSHFAVLAGSVESANRPLNEEWVEPLTPRELQILRMLSEGLPNRAIGTQLQISEHTAKFHVGQILAKLGAESRTEAVTIGIRRGLIFV